MGGAINIIKTKPQPAKGIETAEIAMEIIKSAEEELANGNVAKTYENSLNAIRMAAAALMFMDGYVAPTLESAAEYIKNYHPVLDAERWKKHEYNQPQNKGILIVMLERIGLKKTNEEKEMQDVFLLAKDFVNYANKITKYGKFE